MYLGYILLADGMFVGFDILGVLADPYAFSLAAGLWLQNKRLVLFLSSVGLEVTKTGTIILK